MAEKTVRRRHNNVTVVMDGDTRELIFMQEGKKKEAQLALLNPLSKAQKAGVEAVAMDRGGAYKAAVGEALPKVSIVYDNFHAGIFRTFLGVTFGLISV